MENDPLVEAKVAEAAHAAAIASEAQANAHGAQLEETLVSALRKVLVDGDSEERPMLIKRIPFICKDIADIKNTLWWTSRIASVVGAIMLALVCALIATLRIHL